MALSIGGRSYTNNSAPYASNTGEGHIAQARLDNTISRANSRYKESLSVDGVHLTIWVRGRQGFPCSCTFKRLSADNTIDTVAEGFPEELPSTIENNFKVVRVRGEDTRITGQPAPWDKLPSPPASIFDGDTQAEPEDALLANLMNQITDEEMALYTGNSSGITGGDKHACGICFATGFTQGYSLLNGQRLVFDYSGEIPIHNLKADVDNDSHPYKFRLTSVGSVTWLVTLPTYTFTWLNVHIKNNLDMARGLEAQYSTDNITFYPLTVMALVNTDDTVRTWYIRVAKDSNIINFEDIPEFTHLEISYSAANPYVGQLPQISQAMNWQANEAIIDTTIEMGSDIADIPRESVVFDNKYKRLWKIVNIAGRSSALGQVYGYELSVRSIHKSEMLASLAIQPITYEAINYRGIEQIQGAVGINTETNRTPDIIEQLNLDGI